MPRIARIVMPHFPHHVVHRGNNRTKIFYNDDDRNFYKRILKKYKAETNCELYAYAFMDNHVHGIYKPADKTALAKFMQKLSLCYTQYFNKKYQRTGRLWECRFYSSVIDTDIYLWRACRYIECNPVRAGIVNDPLDYQWSSASFHNKRGEETLISPFWRNNEEYFEYMNFLGEHISNEEIQNIRNAYWQGLPFGGDAFRAYICGLFNIPSAKKPRGRPKNREK